jgi:hypothetical protein
MTVFGETSPVSGGEHAMSHAMDIYRRTSGFEVGLHGEQVGLTTTISTRIWDDLLERLTLVKNQVPKFEMSDVTQLVNDHLESVPRWSSREKAELLATWTDEERSHWDDLKSQMLESAEFKTQKFQHLLTEWKEFQRNFSELKDSFETSRLSFSSIVDHFEALNIPLECESLSPPMHAHEFRWCLRASPFLRKRFGIQDISVWLLGEDPVILAAV